MAERLPNRTNRDARGKFVKGCAPGPGNPGGRTHARFRQLVADAVSDADLRRIVGKLLERAKAGDLTAIGMVLDRCCGKPATFAELELAPRLEALEGRINHQFNGVSVGVRL